MRFLLKLKNKHKLINACYITAIITTFVLFLTHNNRVEASVDTKNYFSYMSIEDGIASSKQNNDNLTKESASNIKAMFEMVDNLIKTKNIEKVLAFKRGDTLISLLRNSGISRDDANDIYYSFKEHFNPQDFKSGEEIKLNIAIDTKTQDVLKVNYLSFEPAIGKRIITANKDNTFKTYVEKDEFIDEVNTTSGTITGNLSVAMQSKNIPMRIISNFINIFSYSIDFKRDLQKNDKFEIVYETQILPDGTLAKSGDILYAGLILRNQKIALYRYKDSKGHIDYYSSKGQALKKTLDKKPLAFRSARISSPFGRRLHPILRNYKMHWGVDYAAPRGTLVFAGGDGVIVSAKRFGSYGNYIKIRHNSEFSTAYGHLNGFVKGIRPGVRVTQGQPIAYVGSTGRSTGPHLHYEVIQNGRRVNPRTIKASTGENLYGSNLKKFKKVVARINQNYAQAFLLDHDTRLAKK